MSEGGVAKKKDSFRSPGCYNLVREHWGPLQSDD
jgi:hypothetical protein